MQFTTLRSVQHRYNQSLEGSLESPFALLPPRVQQRRRGGRELISEFGQGALSPNPGNPKPLNSTTDECLFPHLQLFEGELVSPTNLVRADEATSYRCCDVGLVNRQPMFDVRWREISKRDPAPVGGNHALESRTFLHRPARYPVEKSYSYHSYLKTIG